MIAYDDLVVALSSWRAGQGLPPNTVNFLSADSGSVDLALPVADGVEAMELETGEMQALDDDYAVDEYAADEYVADEYAADEYAVAEPVASDDPFGAEAGDDASNAMADAMPEDDSASPVHALNYDDDESEQTAIANEFEAVTSYGDGASATPPELASPDYVDEMSAAADESSLNFSGDEADQALDANLSEASDAPRTEEVDVLSEEFAADEEGPTQFGNLDREATEMGVGIASLQQPGPRRDITDDEE